MKDGYEEALLLRRVESCVNAERGEVGAGFGYLGMLQRETSGDQALSGCI